MTSRDRFRSVLNFEKPDDRLPMVEWAAWWDKTTDRWMGEGLPGGMTLEESQKYFDLDVMMLISANPRSAQCPSPAGHGAPIITDEQSYDKIRPYLYTDECVDHMVKGAMELKKKHERGEVILRLWLDGFFWFPRNLLGIENHFYAFYDHPGLMHRINEDLAEFNLRAVKELCGILVPDMVGFAEDMSYNHGPMLSHELYREFLLPYYQYVIPAIKKQGSKVFVDSDGDVTDMIPWLQEAGIEGVYPLERQAGVDLEQIRKNYPDFLMMGGYDKMVMSKGKDEMRAEFERLLPVMKSGGYIPSVDHQTPPGVSLANYRIYMELFREYSYKAVGN